MSQCNKTLEIWYGDKSYRYLHWVMCAEKRNVMYFFITQKRLTCIYVFYVKVPAVKRLRGWDLLLLWQLSKMKFSWAISQVNWLSSEKTNISNTISVLILRVLVWLWLRKNILSNLYLAWSAYVTGRWAGSMAALPTDLLRKQTGPGINWTECIFPTITRLAPWGRGQRWSLKHWFSHHSTNWPGW
jgi:hypothetical protein